MEDGGCFALHKFKRVSQEDFLRQTNVLTEVGLIINLITEAFVKFIILGGSFSSSLHDFMRRSLLRTYFIPYTEGECWA